MNLQCHGQVEILLLGLWDPSSGNLFAEEGDQQRFWKITRKFIEQMAIASGPGRIKAVSWSATGSHLPLDYLEGSCPSFRPFDQKQHGFHRSSILTWEWQQC